jgi:tRNA threonylcarbamoyladenosine biosynthesis protein TsaB
VALWDDAGPVASRAFVNHMELSARLVPTIERMLSEEKLALTDMHGIAVSLGPGSFTGLRIGVATAKTLAQVAGLPVIGVDTMDSVALPYEPLARGGTCLVVTMSARRGFYYVRWYSRGECDTDRTIRMLSTDELRERLALATSPVLLLGDAALREGLTGTGMPILAGAHHPHALNAAYIGHERLVKGEIDDPLTLTPLYVGRSAAEERREGYRP